MKLKEEMYNDSQLFQECTHSVCRLIRSKNEKKWRLCKPGTQNLKGQECYLACEQAGSDICWSTTEYEKSDFPPEFLTMMQNLRGFSVGIEPIPLPIGK